MVPRKVVLFGFGRWGRNWARVLNERNLLAAVVDASEETAHAAALAYPTAAVFTTAEEFLRYHGGEYDAAVIASPPNTHVDIGLMAIESGMHIVVEKPVAGMADDAMLLWETAHDHSRILMADYTFLYSQPVQRMFLALRQIAPVRHAELTWTGTGPRRLDVDVIANLAPHPLSILGAMTGSMPDYTQCATRCWHACDWDHVDWALAIFNWEELDFSATVTICWDHPEKQRHLVCTGERGHIICNPTKGEIEVMDLQGNFLLKDLSIGPEPLGLLIDEFLWRCNSGIQPIAAGGAGIRLVQQMMDLMRHSASLRKQTIEPHAYTPR